MNWFMDMLITWIHVGVWLGAFLAGTVFFIAMLSLYDRYLDRKEEAAERERMGRAMRK